MDDERKQIEFEGCEVRCPNCGTVWRSSLTSGVFPCPNCKDAVSPHLHVVVQGEKDVN